MTALPVRLEALERPKRIQLSRAKGWRMPPNCVKVDRTTRFGNPWKVDAYLCAYDAVEAFRHFVTDQCPEDEWLAEDWHKIVDNIPSLRGKDIGCWCRLDAPCHGDVYLELANPPIAEALRVVRGIEP